MASDAADPNEEPGTRVKSGYTQQLGERLAETQRKLRKLKKLGARWRSPAAQAR